MAARPPIQIRYNRSIVYSNTQGNYIGAQDTAGRRGSLPTFTDVNAKWVKKTGSDAAAGTEAAPYLTIQKALDSLVAAFSYAVVQDSETYREKLDLSYTATGAGGLYAKDGENPTIERARGAISGTYGARLTGRVKFSAGAYPGTFYFVSKAGNDGTGTRGNIALPFLTIQGALDDVARANGDTISLEDDGIYEESLTIIDHPVTIQAKDGKLPSIKLPLVDTTLISDAAVDLSLYGLQLVGRSEDPTVSTIIATFNLVGGTFAAYDCSIEDSRYGFNLANADNMDIQNCYFVKNDVNSIQGPVNSVSLIIKNSFFEKNGYFYYSALGIGNNYAVWIRGPNVGTVWPDVLIEECTWDDARIPACLHLGTGTGSITAGEVIVRNCEFLGYLGNEINTSGIVLDSTSQGLTCNIDNCYFYRLTDSAIATQGTETAFNVDGMLAEECSLGRGDGSFGDYFFHTDTFTVENLASIGSADNGVHVCCVGSGTVTVDGVDSKWKQYPLA